MMTLNKNSSEHGSALFIVLIAIALFTALTYAMSQQNNSAASLSVEKIRLLSSDIMDMGNKLSDSVSRLRLNKISNTNISFENSIVTGYTNPTCTVDTCKIFAFDGGGRDWETPTTDISSGQDWAFTGSLAIQNMGTTDTDLVAFLPNIPLSICNRINTSLGWYGTTGAPPSLTGISAAKFTGTYGVAPVNISHASLQGQKSGCIQLGTVSGTAFSGTLPSTFYTFYQVLEAR
jgi:hypothetical protein